MPTNRPKKAYCYFNRDDHYLQALQKTLRGIVIEPPIELSGKLSLDKAAETILASAKMTPAQLQMAFLPQNKFLALLPSPLDKDEVVAAIPRRIWDEGYKFSSYSPLSDTSVSIPLFKLWIDITGVPIKMQRESHMAQVVSSFGLYLGSIEPQIHGDCSSWSIFLATDDLAQVPHELDLKIGGMVYTALIRPRRCFKGQVFHRPDLPPTAISYLLPSSPLDALTTEQTDTLTPEPTSLDADHFVPVRLTTLKELLKGVPPSTMPQDLAVFLGRNTATAETDHAAGRRKGTANTTERRRPAQTPTQSTTPNPATPDPSHLSITPIESQNPPIEPTTVPLHPTARMPDQTLPALSENLPTVHRTDKHAVPKPCSQIDLALQVCPNATAEKNDEGGATSWAPHLLFPEIDLTLPQLETTPLTLDKTDKRAGPQLTRGPNPNPTRRTARNRTKSPSDNDATLIDLDVHDFIDIPLQLPEGRQLLTLISASSVTIPADLLVPTHPQPLAREKGQTSNAKQKRKKPTSPTAQEQNVQPNLKSSKHAGRDPPPRKPKSQQPMPRLGQRPLSQPRPTPLQTQQPQRQIQKDIASLPATLPKTAPNTGPDQQEDDPYLDRVVYSGDEGQV